MDVEVAEVWLKRGFQKNNNPFNWGGGYLDIKEGYFGAEAGLRGAEWLQYSRISLRVATIRGWAKTSSAWRS